ncbi:alkaline phosphatase family protein [Sphingomonas arenae]|uniref:alkaline phosphatase family protein n=1 Tax=Sphingomonas arenae TaxID=2812555 RepID=UPI001967A9F8|nr:alkaline phosphatase family protein [Sphingomonas arenae]
MRSSLLAAAAALAFPSATAQAQPAPPPKLVVAISIDQFSADLFDAYRPFFTAGLKRLASGTAYPNGYQSHAATETCPGHSTILTGHHPSATGIVANAWIDQGAARTDKNVYCSEDERVPGSTFANYTVSPEHLRTGTLGDRLKAVSPGSRNVAVAGKDRAAVMMGGRAVDQRWYWDGKTFSTDLKTAPVPQSVTLLKAAVEVQLAQPRGPLEPNALCQAKGRAYPVSPTLTVGANRLERAAGDTRTFRASPELDGATLALAAGLQQELGLGRGQTTDVLSIGLSSTDYVGHSYGSGGMEMCLQLLALDRELGDFLARLDGTGVDYAVVVTADHGGMDIPERLREQGIAQAQRADPGLAAAEVGKILAPQVGRTTPVLLGEGISGDVWLDRSLPDADKRRVLEAAVQRYRAHPQVEAVFTADELRRTPLPSGAPKQWTLIQRARASFDPARSGDFLVVLKEYISPIARPSTGYTATHGSPWDYDRRVPILFWRKGAGPAERSEAVDTADIMPTLAAMIGLKVAPGSVDGRCLEGAAGVFCSR